MSEQKHLESPHTTPRLLAAGAVATGLLLSACASPSPETPTSTSQETTSTLDAHQWEITDVEAEDSVLTAQSIVLSPARLGVVDPKQQKFETVDTDLGSQTYLPVAEVKVVDGKVVFQDVSPDGMNEEVSQWFTERFSHRAPLVEEALKSGAIDRVVIALDDAEPANTYADTSYTLGYYDHQNKQNVFEISAQSLILDAEFFEQYVTHEVGHAVFSDASVSHWAESAPSQHDLEKFKAACSNLRDLALQDIQHNLWSAHRAVTRLSEVNPDPVLKQRYALLADAIETGEWTQLVPTTANSPDAALPECSIYTIGGMARIIGDLHGLGELQSGEMTSEQIDAIAPHVDDANMALQSTIGDMSLYRVLKEGTYDYENEAMGHPYDNVDELAASTLNILISYPDQLASKVRSLAPEEKSAVLDVLRQTIDQTIQAHPNLQGYLADKEAEFLKLLNR